ncbi:HEAT repeat domain-containing protein [Geobacter sp.]|uniref:HEAT repeat domain-containing protein n=1 Tax=Geobacter sp. TaxID=46610 RepID=UPI0027BABD8D|nr:HEAT repeat domain-containing protein [Geobacter sp.]
MRGEIGDLRHYLVQVLNPAGEVEGTGFLCHPEGYVLTCWHVIETWRKAGCETGEVYYQGSCIKADLCLDCSVRGADLAVLKLHRRQPDETSPWPHLPLDVYWRVQLGDELHSFGYPAGQFDESGIGFRGSMGALTPTPIKGLESYPITGLNLKNVDGGYSGAPVVDQRLQKVIGLVYAKHRATQAFIVPLRPLFEGWPELRVVHDVFEQIRTRLGEEAHAKLEEKMHHAPFIPLNLDCGVISERQEQEAGEEAKAYEHGRTWNAFEPKRLLPPRQSYILSSDVGMGKTVFVYWLTAELVRRTRVVPWLMSCQDLERIDPKSGMDLRAVLAGRLEDVAADVLAVDRNDFFEQAEKEKRFVFLFDGLDQIRGMPSKLAEIAFTTTGKMPVLITSRPSAVLAIENDPKLEFLRLKPFSPQDQRRYFGERYSQVKSVCALAPDLAQVPLLASMVRELAVAGKLKEAVTRTELYGKFVEHILAEHEPNRPRYHDEPDLSRKIKSQLKDFAFLALADVEPKIQKVPAKLYPEDARVSLKDLTTFGLVNRVLDRGEEALFFTHQSFQEFLAAQYAADKPEEINRILTERWHPKWAEVIRFLAGLLGEPIIQRILAEPDNVIHSNLFLAARCVPEIKTPTPVIIQTIKEQLLELAEKEPFREAAITALVGLGQELETCDVLAWLRDENYFVRQTVVLLLGSISERLDAEMVREFVALLGDENPTVRETAAWLLGLLGDRLEAEAMYKLVDLIRDSSFLFFGSAAANALGLISDRLEAGVVHKLVSLLHHKDSFVRQNAVRALSRLVERQDAAEAVDELVGLVCDENSSVRRAAVQALGSLGDRLAPEAVRALLARLGDKYSNVREATITALGSHVNLLDVEAVRELLTLLEDEYYLVRKAATEVIGLLGDRMNKEVVRKLLTLLSDRHFSVRRAAVDALASLGDRLDKEVILKFLALLGDKDFSVRTAAVKALVKLGDRLDEEVMGKLRGMLSDRDFPVRTAVVESLGKLGDRLDAEAVCALVALFGDRDFSVRRAVAGVFGELGDRLDAESLHELVALLGDENSYVRQAAAQSLGKLSDRLDADAVNNLVALLSDENASVRCAVVQALGKFGDRLDADAVNNLVALLSDENVSVRRAAAHALGKINDQMDAQVVHELVALLGDKDYSVQMASTEVLGLLGSRLDAEDIRAIAGFLDASDRSARTAARRTLEHIYSIGISV